MPDFTKKLTCLFLACEVWTGCPPARGMDQIREGDQKLDYFCPSYLSLLWVLEERGRYGGSKVTTERGASKHWQWTVVIRREGEERIQKRGRGKDLSSKQAKPTEIWIEDSGPGITEDPSILLFRLNHSAPFPAAAQVGRLTHCPETPTS